MSDLRSAGDDPAELDATVAELVDHRLLTSTGAEDGTDRRIDLAHEALISGWPTLRGWLADRRDAEQTRRQLEAKAAEWVRLGRGQGGLLDEIELAETERWLESPDAAELGVDPALTEVAAASRAALDRSRAARRRRVRTLVGSLAVGLLLVTGLAVWGAVSARSARREERRALAAQELADEQRAEAEAQRAEAEALARTSLSRQLAADALQQRERNLDRAMLLAVAAYRTEPTPQATSGLVATLEFSPRLIRILNSGSEIDGTSVTFTSEDEQVAAVIDGVLRRWDAATGAALGPEVRVVDDPLVPTIAFSADGSVLAAENCLANDPDQPCPIHLWDVTTGTELGDPVESPSPYVTTMAFSPDRRLLAMANVGSTDPAIRLWDIEAARWLGGPMRTRARSLAFSPDGRLLASGLEPTSFAGGETSVSMWDVASQELVVETPVVALGGGNALGLQAGWLPTRGGARRGWRHRVEPVRSAAGRGVRGTERRVRRAISAGRDCPRHRQPRRRRCAAVETRKSGS